MTLHSRRSLLVLSLDDDQLTALAANGSTTPLTAPLAVDPLTDDPPLVAQELRERLHPLGRTPRRVIVLLPLHRVSIAHVVLPELPDDAVDSYLKLQAEREFMLAPQDMALAVSRHTLPDGRRAALLAALPATQYANLQRSLRLIGGKRLQVLPATALAVPADTTAATLLAGPRSVNLALSTGGGLLLLRRLAGAIPGAQRPGPDNAAVPGELRITLRQLPEGVRGALQSLAVTGASDAVDQLVPLLESTVGAALPVARRPLTGTLANDLCARALAAAAEPPLVLAPPQIVKARGLLSRWGRRQVTIAAAAALIAILAIAGLIINQRRQLSQLRDDWATLSPRVTAVRAVMDEAKARQPWFTDTPESLDVLRAVTLAFPEYGTVWVTRLEIKDRQVVAVAGKATSREAWLTTLDALRRTPGIRDLRVAQAREGNDAKQPMTFALSFEWQPSAARTTKEATP